MRKIIKLFVCMLLALTCASCRRTHAPNERRGTNYKYDFMDFLTVTLYGDNGSGIMEISPVEIAVNDFDSEDEYIKVKKDLALISPTVNQGSGSNTKIKLSKSTGLSNGDIVKISVGLKKSSLSSNMNIETYEYVVDGLRSAEQIDLFAEDFVSFYAMEDGSLHAHIKNDEMYSKELTDNLVYSIKSTDGTEPGKSVLTINVDMKESFLKENGYGSMDIYMIKHGLAAKRSNDRVLEKLVHPIDFNASSSIAVERALYKALYDYEGDHLVKVCNLQQTPRQKVSEPYCYMVVFSADEDGTQRYFRRQIEMVYVDGEYVVLDSSNRESTTEKYVYEPFTEANMIMNFTMESWADTEQDVIPEEAIVADETPMPESEESAAQPETQEEMPAQPLETEVPEESAAPQPDAGDPAQTSTPAPQQPEEGPGITQPLIQ